MRQSEHARVHARAVAPVQRPTRRVRLPRAAGARHGGAKADLDELLDAVVVTGAGFLQLLLELCTVGRPPVVGQGRGEAGALHA